MLLLFFFNVYVECIFFFESRRLHTSGVLGTGVQTCALPIAGEQTIQDIILNDKSWYESNGITLNLNSTVTQINRRRKEVLTDDGKTARYDRLLLATAIVRASCNAKV